MSVTTNIQVVIGENLALLEALENNPDIVLRHVAEAVLPILRHRVHVEGKDSSGGQIGIYSPGYMVVRQGSFGNAARYSKGSKKGELKSPQKKGDAGVHIQGSVKGSLRPRYNRGPSTKVILSLTSEMENDMHVLPTNINSPGYGIGYLNPLNFDKALWCEDTYNKPILTELTTEEINLSTETAQGFTDKYIAENN